jgi:hypothetical protein
MLAQADNPAKMQTQARIERLTELSGPVSWQRRAEHIFSSETLSLFVELTIRRIIFLLRAVFD